MSEIIKLTSRGGDVEHYINVSYITYYRPASFPRDVYVGYINGVGIGRTNIPVGSLVKMKGEKDARNIDQTPQEITRLIRIAGGGVAQNE